MFDLTRNNAMIQLMDLGMTVASKRQALIASNLANVDTPGYRTRDFSFEGALKQALDGMDGHNLPLSRTHAGHLAPSPSSPLPPTTDPSASAYERNDGNDVNLDRENMNLAKTQETYQMASLFMQTELRKLYLVAKTN